MKRLVEFHYSLEEFLLLTLKSGVPLRGIDYSPIADMNETRLKTAWETCRTSLQNKGFIGQDSPHSIEIDAEILRLLTICQNPKDVFCLQITEESKVTKMVAYFIDENEIVSIDKEDSNLGVKMTGHGNLVNLFDHIHQSIDLREYGSEEIEDVTIHLSKSQYFHFMSALHMKSVGKAVNVVVTNGIPEAFAKDAVEGFANKSYFVSFSYLDEDKVSEQVMFYKGDRFLWGLVTSDSEASILQLSAIPPHDCYESIHSLLRAKMDKGIIKGVKTWSLKYR